MKPMRVLNCTKKQREAIFTIADEVGFPVYRPTREQIDYDTYRHITISGGEITGTTNSSPFGVVSFSEFITELLKYEKPKVWVRKETAPMTNVEVEIESSPIAWCYIPKNSRNHKFTYEVEE